MSFSFFKKKKKPMPPSPSNSTRQQPPSTTTTTTTATTSKQKKSASHRHMHVHHRHSHRHHHRPRHYHLEALPDVKEDPEIVRFRQHLLSKALDGKLTKSHFKLGATLGTGTFGRVRLVHYDEEADDERSCSSTTLPPQKSPRSGSDGTRNSSNNNTPRSTPQSKSRSKNGKKKSAYKSLSRRSKSKYKNRNKSNNNVTTNFIGDTLTPNTSTSSIQSSNRRDWILAFKMLKKREILRLKQVDHIKSEKKILSRLAHPFIVNLYGTFQDDQCIYMVMEYILGGELFSQLRRVGRFSNDASRFFAAEIVLALEYLHAKDIVYRDLKPENLLIDKAGHIKLTDFGFAKQVEDRTWTLCGTPEYLAPEIIQSKGHGKAVDWWALGVLIYEMLAGYPPFYDESPFRIYQKILAGKIEFPRHFDPHAKDLVKKLLTPDRKKRFGCLANGAQDVKKHRWFKHVDWLKVHKKETRPPIIPSFKSEDDTRNFDDYPSSDDEVGPPLDRNDAKHFEDF